jgi:gamma-D-glutamyl-L-lysine dipeptidyl-peptidase
MIKTVNVSVSNVYKNSTYQSDIVSQALLGESVEVIKTENDFDNVKQPDGYEGWIKNNQLAVDNSKSESIKTIISHAIQIYSEMDESSYPVRDAVIGSKINVVDEEKDWYRIELPDGTEGWILKKHFGEFPKLSRENVVKLAKQFLGYPYFWGGLSPRGLDCSGLSQTVFKLLGYQLPRDSYMQRDATKETSKNISDALEGDLLFFGDDKIKVDHVGIALGDDGIIHARGMVKINSLNKSADNYDIKLDETLIAITTVF